MSSLKNVFILLFISISTFLYAEEYLVRVQAPDTGLTLWIKQNQIETTFSKGRSYIDLYVTEDQRSSLTNLGYDFTVLKSK